MSARFVGRQRELEVLEAALKSRQSEFIPVYGRRRVGKSELILQFMSRHPGIYFLGKKAPPDLQIKEFLQEAAKVLDEPLLASLAPQDWKGALSLVVERWKGRSKLVITLDEFQWMAGASPELPSVIQECWDTQWQKSGKVLLILCGSYIGFMEREVLGKKSPLFGRRTRQIFLQPFGYQEAAQFHPGYSETDRAKVYFLCGGIPMYLKGFDSNCSVEKNIIENYLDEFAPLYREPDFLLREELREVETYYAVLLAAATNARTHKEIASRQGIEERSLHYYLQQLVDLGYLSRQYPLSDRKPAARHVRYVLEDPLLKFWFRFVYPNNSYINMAGGARSFKDRIKPELDAYFGTCFEVLCREALGKLYQAEGTTAPFEIGQYWNKETQIDVVGFREDNWTDLAECKWGEVKSAKALAEELEKKVGSYPNLRNATIGKRVFTRKKLRAPKSAGRDIRWHSLPDLYRA